MSTEVNDLMLTNLEDENQKEVIATLEQLDHSLDTCGFGKYQWRMLLISFPGILAHVFVTMSTQYALALAEKYGGKLDQLIFVMPNVGIIISSIISGFLSDVFGRRKVIIVCYAGLAVATFVEGVVQTYTWTLFSKFLEGFFLAGAFVASTNLQVEFQTDKSRDRIMMTLNFFVAISHILLSLPSLVAGVLYWEDVDMGKFARNFWDVYVVLSSVFGLSTCLLYMRLPESPKYDFAHGNYDNALQTIKRIYSINKRKSGDEFPYKIDETTVNEFNSYRKQVRLTWSQVKLVFEKPLLKFVIIIMAIQMVFSFSYNTIRLWLPTVMTVLDDTRSYSYSPIFLCGALIKPYNGELFFLQILYGHLGYCVIMFLAGIIPYILVTIFINIGKRLILLASLCICCCCVISMHFIVHPIGNIIVLCVFLAFGQVFLGVIQAIVIKTFPVWIKSLALSLALVSSAIGSVLAEYLFSYFVLCGCHVATIVAALIACTVLFGVFLPK